MKQIYLNNAASAFPPAPGVLEAVAACMGSPPRVSGRDSFGLSDALSMCRNSLARLMDVGSNEIALTYGATHGLNMAILGLGLNPGDLVVTSVTEHNSVLRPLARLEDLLCIRVEQIPLDPDMRLDAAVYDELLRQKPRLVVLNHAGNVTGRINPVASWLEKAKSAGAATLLDASQTIGRIPVRPYELNADMTAFSGHKGLRGPLGTGALHVASGVSLTPVLVGGTGVKSDLRLQPEEMPMRLESGTPNTPAFAGLDAAVTYILENASRIAAAERAMTEKLYSGLAALRHVRIFDAACDDRLPTASFAVQDMDVDQAGFALSESFGVQCRTGLHCAPLIHAYLGSLPGGTIRFSPSFATSPEEIETAIDAVRRLA
jgi:selenocysteine lyase/cysteine desulfurase